MPACVVDGIAHCSAKTGQRRLPLVTRSWCRPRPLCAHADDCIDDRIAVGPASTISDNGKVAPRSTIPVFIQFAAQARLEPCRHARDIRDDEPGEERDKRRLEVIGRGACPLARDEYSVCRKIYDGKSNQHCL